MLSYIFPVAEIVFLSPPRSSVTLGPLASEPLILAALLGLVLLAVLVILLARLRPARARRSQQPWILVDGSNVMHWKDNVPQIATVRAVVRELEARGFAPGVVFDANAGYKLADGYMNEARFARLVALPESQIFVVPKGTQADPYILSSAREFGARIVTRDRFRDWAEVHPEVKEPGFLIRGGYRDSGELWLDEVAPPVAETAA